MSIFTSKAIASERLAVCFSCEKITSAGPKRCTICNCYMRAKVQLRKAECPIGKWGKAPLTRSDVKDYSEYWRQENEIIAQEMMDATPDEARFSLSSEWAKNGKSK